MTCIVCHRQDAEVVELSSGLTLHPHCWPNLRAHHVNAAFAHEHGWYARRSGKQTP